MAATTHISQTKYANLADLNRVRFARFGTQEKKPAMYAFAGDTYQGLDAKTLADDDLVWAQDHLRILSGLYGLLRPLDEICLLYTSPSPRDRTRSRMPSSA